MQQSKPRGYSRLPDVLKRIPVSRSAFWKGIQDGRFPPGVKLSIRTTAWLNSDIAELEDLLADGKDWRDHVDRKAA